MGLIRAAQTGGESYEYSDNNKVKEAKLSSPTTAFVSGTSTGESDEIYDKKRSKKGNNLLKAFDGANQLDSEINEMSKALGVVKKGQYTPVDPNDKLAQALKNALITTYNEMLEENPPSNYDEERQANLKRSYVINDIDNKIANSKKTVTSVSDLKGIYNEYANYLSKGNEEFFNNRIDYDINSVVDFVNRDWVQAGDKYLDKDLVDKHMTSDNVLDVNGYINDYSKNMDKLTYDKKFESVFTNIAAEEGFTGAIKYDMKNNPGEYAALVMDLTSAGLSLGQVTAPAAGIVGLGATSVQLTSDLNNPKVSSGEAWTNAAINGLLDAGTLIPGLTTIAKGTKMAKYIPKFRKVIKLSKKLGGGKVGNFIGKTSQFATYGIAAPAIYMGLSSNDPQSQADAFKLLAATGGTLTMGLGKGIKNIKDPKYRKYLSSSVNYKNKRLENTVGGMKKISTVGSSLVNPVQVSRMDALDVNKYIPRKVTAIKGKGTKSGSTLFSINKNEKSNVSYDELPYNKKNITEIRNPIQKELFEIGTSLSNSKPAPYFNTDYYTKDINTSGRDILYSNFIGLTNEDNKGNRYFISKTGDKVLADKNTMDKVDISKLDEYILVNGIPYISKFKKNIKANKTGGKMEELNNYIQALATGGFWSGLLKSTPYLAEMAIPDKREQRVNELYDRQMSGEFDVAPTPMETPTYISPKIKGMSFTQKEGAMQKYRDNLQETKTSDLTMNIIQKYLTNKSTADYSSRLNLQDEQMKQQSEAAAYGVDAKNRESYYATLNANIQQANQSKAANVMNKQEALRKREQALLDLDTEKRANTQTWVADMRDFKYDKYMENQYANQIEKLNFDNIKIKMAAGKANANEIAFYNQYKDKYEKVK